MKPLIDRQRSTISGPYGTAPTAQVQGHAEILDEMGSLHQLEHGQAPRYHFVPVSADEGAHYRLSESLRRGLHSVLSPYSGNLLRHAYATGGEIWHLTRRQHEQALIDNQPRIRYAMVGGAGTCEVSAFIVFTELCHRVDPSTIDCVELMISEDADHAFTVATLQDGQRIVHDHWTGPQACRWEHYRFSDRSDCKVAMSWRPGEELPPGLEVHVAQSLEDESTGYDLRPHDTPDMPPHERLLSLMEEHQDAEPGIEKELRTETDCLLTPDQKAKLGLGPHDVIVYESPDGTLFSNDFVPRAHLDEIDRLQLGPDRKQLIKRCKAVIDWKERIHDACRDNDHAKIQSLMQERPRDFAIFCAKVANEIWQGFNDDESGLSPPSDQMKQALRDAGATVDES